jgi:hypothetical protein
MTASLVLRAGACALLLAAAAPATWSQDAVRADRFTVALWPEYDRSAVLVTYRVELAPEVALPAQVDLPIPLDVGPPHAVAKLGADGTLYLASATRVVDGEWAIMQVSTDRRYLQLEYYAPFSTSGDVREFTYRWPGGLEIGEFGYEVLPPVSAVNVEVTPRPSNQAMSDLGVLTYLGKLGPRTAGQPQTIAITYTNPGGRLSVTPAPAPPAVSPPALIFSDEQPPATKKRSSPATLLVVLGIAAVVLAGLWFARRSDGPSVTR